MRNNHASYIELEAAQLPTGESMRTMCPACDGGSTKERSLQIVREPWGLRAHCFRASCPFYLKIGGPQGGMGDVPIAVGQEHERYTGTFEPLDADDTQYFFDRFGLEKIYTPGRIGHNAFNQYVMPIFDTFNVRRGFVVRQKPWGGEPAAPRQPRNPYSGMARKVRSWGDKPDTIMLSVYSAQNRHLPARVADEPGTIVLTEDQISAMKAAQAGVTGVALLGVGLNLDKVRELQRLRPRRVVVALDPDAGHLSFEMVRKWSAAFPSMRVALLEQDLKDTPSNDVLSALGL